VADVGCVVYAIVDALEKLDEWTAPEKISRVPAWRSGWDTTVYRAPKGTAVIITCVLSAVHSN